MRGEERLKNSEADSLEASTSRGTILYSLRDQHREQKKSVDTLKSANKSSTEHYSTKLYRVFIDNVLRIPRL